MRVIGLMSGTSLDAVDAALVEISSGDGLLDVSLVTWTQEPWPAELRETIRGWSAVDASVSLAELGAVSMEIGELFARAAERCARSSDVRLDEVELICSHGQTVHHHVDAAGRALATLQLGEPAVIAERTGCTVAADFRPRDIAAGGQGAPLVSFVDALMLAEEGRTVAALNLGGIANLTVIPAGGAAEAVAFDTGPANSLLDSLARQLLGQPFDRDGAAAAAGRPSAQLLDELLGQPYFDRPPPKSTGRELFGDAYASHVLARGRAKGLSANDLLATATELTARSVAAGLARWAPTWPAVVHVSGGGASNPHLLGAVERALVAATPRRAAAPEIVATDRLGLPAQAKEAVAFAILGHETLHGRSNNVPRCTGARRSTVLGAVWPGSNYMRVLQLVTQSQQGQPIGRIRLSRSSQQRKGEQR